MNPSGPGLFLVGRLLIAASILLSVSSGIQLLPGLVLGGCKHPGIYLLLIVSLVYVHRGLWSSDSSLYFLRLVVRSLIVFLLHLFDSSFFSFLLVWIAVYKKS